MTNWPVATLGDICDIQIGRTPARKNPSYWGDGHAWLSIRDMNQGTTIRDTRESITQHAVDELKMRPVPAGTVLFSFKLSIGKVGITSREMFTNEAIAAFTPKDEAALDMNFLLHFLQLAGPRLQGNRAVMGATLNKRSLASIAIPLPPLDEQRRIAQLLEQSEYLRGYYQKKKELFQKAIRGILDSSIDAAPDCRPFNEVALLSGGLTPPKSNLEFWNEGSIPWFSTKDLRRDFLTDSIDHVTEQAIASTSLKKIPYDTVALSIRGMSLAHRVPISVIPAGSTINQDLKVIRSSLQYSALLWLEIFKSKEHYLLSKVATSAHGTKRLEVSHILNMDVPIWEGPELSTVESLVSKQASTMASFDHLLRCTDELYNSLATRAFAGEL